MKQIDYDEVVNRIGYFRNRAHLSGRATSLELGYNSQFIKTIENKSIELKVKTLLDFCDVVGITPCDFFYLGKDYNENDKNLLELYSKLSSDDKDIVIELMKKLGK